MYEITYKSVNKVQLITDSYSPYKYFLFTHIFGGISTVHIFYVHREPWKIYLLTGHSFPSQPKISIYSSDSLRFLRKGIEFLSQTLIFLSLCLCISMSEPLDISNYELF